MNTGNQPTETGLCGPFHPGPAWRFGRILTRAEVDRLYACRDTAEAKRVATLMGGRPILPWSKETEEPTP